MIDNKQEVRDKILYYQNLLEIVETPTFDKFIEQLEQFISATNGTIARRLLLPSTDREKMIKILDDVIETKGICKGVQTIINMTHPDSIRVILEDLEEELKPTSDE